MLTDNLVEFWKLNGSRIGINGIGLSSSDGLEHFSSDGVVGQCWSVAQTLNRTLHHQGPEITGAGPWTMSLWVRYPDAYTLPGRRIAGLRDDANGTQKISLLLNGEEDPNQIVGATVIVAGTTLAVGVAPPINFDDGEWVHVVLRYSPGTGCTLTINGQHHALSTSAIASAATTPHLTFGGYYTTATDVDGVDAVGWWSRCISDDEVASLYNAGAGLEISAAADDTPDAFAFDALTGAARNTQYTSDAIAITGMDAGTAISVADGEYSIDGGTFTAAAGTINPGQSVRLRRTSSADYSTTVSATLTVGTVYATWEITTGNPGPLLAAMMRSQELKPQNIFQPVTPNDSADIPNYERIEAITVAVAGNVVVEDLDGNESTYALLASVPYPLSPKRIKTTSTATGIVASWHRV